MMKLFITTLTLLTHSFLIADSLMDALLDGNLTHKINATYSDNVDEEMPFSSSRTQKILFNYQTAPINGLKFEVATQSFSSEAHQSSTDNTLYYSEARYHGNAEDIGYNLSVNYYADTYHNLYEKSLDTTNAVGLKAQMNYDSLSTYVAYSKVMEGMHSASSSFDGKDKLLPTSSVLSSNNYAPNTQAYALDINYALSKDFSLGSRYVLANDEQSNLSYTGVYTNFQLDELSKGLHIGVAYDKTGLDKQNDQVNFTIKSKF